MTTKAYAIGCLSALLALLGLAATLNRVIDPFWFYGDFNLPGVNAARTEFAQFERHIKPVILARNRPQAVIFGNSYTEIGLDPLHPAFTHHGRLTGYNFAMAGSDWGLVYCNVLYALEHTDLRRVVIGIQAGPLPPVNCADLAESGGSLSAAELLLSGDALAASWRTLTHQHKGPSHTADGRFFSKRERRDRVETSWRREMIYQITRYGYKSSSCWTDPAQAIRATAGLDPEWAEPTKRFNMKGLNALLQRLAERGVTVKLLVYPVHAQGMELRIACGEAINRWQSLLQIVRAAEAVPQPAGGSVELWDFQGTADPLVERIRNNETRIWQDVGHYNVEMGNTMLEAMFGGGASGPRLGGDVFGVRLTSTGLVDRFREFYRNRKAFLAAQPWFHQDLAALLTDLAKGMK